MWQFLSSDGMIPFTGAFLFVAGLVVLETISLILGGSLMGLDSDGPDIDAVDADFDADFETGLDSEVDLDAADALEGDAAIVQVQDAGGFLGWVGLKDAPFVLWLAGVATAFAVSGYALQLFATSLFGGAIPSSLAALIALVPGLWGGKFFAAFIARLAPKTESTAVSRRHLSGRRGVITQGVAARGRPAECRIMDRHGQHQYVRAEPQKDGDVIPQGTDVIVLRPNKNGIYPVIPFE